LTRIDADETLTDIAKTFRVDTTTIGRLKNQRRAAPTDRSRWDLGSE
jgi:hypothetical protein